MTKEFGNIVDGRARATSVSENAVSEDVVSSDTAWERSVSARFESAASSADAAVSCDLCGTPMYSFHCRLICPNCGFQRDCSDP